MRCCHLLLTFVCLLNHLFVIRLENQIVIRLKAIDGHVWGIEICMVGVSDGIIYFIVWHFFLACFADDTFC